MKAKSLLVGKLIINSDALCGFKLVKLYVRKNSNNVGQDFISKNLQYVNVKSTTIQLYSTHKISVDSI